MKEYIIDNAKQALIKKALLETYFRDKSSSFLESEHGKIDVDANVNNRYLRSLQHIVPWVAKQIDLKNKHMVEIGCGTGSSTAAFSYFVKNISAYDIDKDSIDAAKRRMEILDLHNSSFFLVEPENLLETIQTNHTDKIDIILLFAVLEHMTIQERHDTINFCWDMLNDGGILVVVETPNLLQYFDSHTSVLPFFHLLHSDLCAKYSPKSKRDGFNDNFSKTNLTQKEIDLKMTRWGRGVSYHDFELTLGPNYSEYIVSNGYEPEILSWFSVNTEEEVLRYYISEKGYEIPPGLTRVVLNLIFMKGNVPKTDVINNNVPPISIGMIKPMMKKLSTLEKELDEKSRLLDQILSSKRWRLGNIVAAPYRLFRRLLGQDV